MTYTDDELRAMTARTRQRAGVTDADASKLCFGEALTPKAIPCAGCGARTLPPWPLVRRGAIEAWNARAAVTCLTCQRAAAEQRRQAERREEEEQRAAALAAIRADPPAALASIGVPPRWQQARLDDCPDLPATLIDRARAWAGEPRETLYLTGLPGSGKTTVAVAILREIICSGRLAPRHCRYMHERTYLDTRRQHADGAPRATPSWPLLVLDDLGSSRLTDWGRGEVCGLIEEAHARQYPLVIASNLTLAQVANAIDGRIASRIGEGHNVISFPPRDLRVTLVQGTTSRGGAAWVGGTVPGLGKFIRE